MADNTGTVPTTSSAPTPAPVPAPAPTPASVPSQAPGPTPTPTQAPSAQTPAADSAAAVAPAPVPAPAPTSADQPIIPDAAIEVDPVGHDDNDSGYDESIASQFTSLASSVTDYKHENGRRYHAFREGSYFFPNDEQEQDRLDIHNFLMTLCLDGRLHLAPIDKDLKRILDIGTGTGSWAIDMGDLYPSAQVVGNDLSPTQPKWVPANVFFEVDDIEDEWVYSTPFDFIHSRYMACSIKDWPKLLERTFKHTKPGGWIEFQDWDLELFSDDGSLKKDSDLLIWDQLILEACDKVGREASPGKYLEEWVTQAGFVNINHQRFRVPVGPWAKDPRMKKIGAAMQLQMLEGLEGFTLAPLTRVLGWKLEEVEILIAKVRTDLRTSRIHAQADFHVIYAQRPEEPAT